MDRDPNLSGYLFHALHQAHRTAMQEELAAQGLDELGSPMLMMLLQSRRENGDNPTQRELAEALLVSPAAIAMSLKSLERLGYVEKRTDREDQRRKRISVTPRGEAAVEKCWRALAAINRRMLEGFSYGEQEQMAEYFQRMLQNLMGTPEGVPQNPFERMGCQCSKP